MYTKICSNPIKNLFFYPLFAIIPYLHETLSILVKHPSFHSTLPRQVLAMRIPPLQVAETFIGNITRSWQRVCCQTNLTTKSNITHCFKKRVTPYLAIDFTGNVSTSIAKPTLPDFVFNQKLHSCWVKRIGLVFGVTLVVSFFPSSYSCSTVKTT